MATEPGHSEGRRPVSVQRRGRVRQRRQAPEGGALRRLRHRRRRVVRHRRRRHVGCSGADFFTNHHVMLVHVGYNSRYDS